jgi:hypothetical protein
MQMSTEFSQELSWSIAKPFSETLRLVYEEAAVGEAILGGSNSVAPRASLVGLDFR